MSIKMLMTYSTAILIILANRVQTKLNYVVCDDGVSACSDGMQCCKRGTGYKCCPSNTCCCQDGYYCCTCSNLRINNVDFFMQSLATVIYDTNATSQNVTEPNALYGAMVLVDSFLNTTGYYKYSRNALGCRDEFEIILKDIINEINILDSQTLEKSEYVSQLTSGLAEIFFHVRKFILDCQHIPDELNSVLKQISLKLTDLQYYFKVFTQIENNLQTISKIIQDIKIRCSQRFYSDCGTSLGDLFKIVLEV